MSSVGCFLLQHKSVCDGTTSVALRSVLMPVSVSSAPVSVRERPPVKYAGVLECFEEWLPSIVDQTCAFSGDDMMHPLFRESFLCVTACGLDTGICCEMLPCQISIDTRHKVKSGFCCRATRM